MKLVEPRLTCSGAENRNFSMPRLGYVVQYCNKYCRRCCIAVADTLYRWNICFDEERSGRPTKAVGGEGVLEVEAGLREAYGGRGTWSEGACDLAVRKGAAKREVVEAVVREVKARMEGPCEFEVVTFGEVIQREAEEFKTVLSAVLDEKDERMLAYVDSEVQSYKLTRPDSSFSDKEEAAFLHFGRMYNQEELAIADILLRKLHCQTLLYPGKLLKYPELILANFGSLAGFVPTLQLVGLTFEHHSGRSKDGVDFFNVKVVEAIVQGDAAPVEDADGHDS